MKQKYIVTNIDKTVQRVMDDQGQCQWLSTGQSLIMTNPPADSYIFHVEELLQEVENELIPIKTLSKNELLEIIKSYVINKKYLTNKEWKELGKNNFDEEAKIIYNLLETYTLSKHVLSMSEFEKLKGEEELNENGGIK